MKNFNEISEKQLSDITGGGGFPINVNVEWSQIRDGIRGGWDGLRGAKNHY